MDTFSRLLSGFTSRDKHNVLVDSEDDIERNRRKDSDPEKCIDMEDTKIFSKGEKPIYRRKSAKKSKSNLGYEADYSGHSSEDYEDSFDLNSSDLEESSENGQEDDEYDYESSEDSSFDTFSFADLPLKDILTTRRLDDGVIRVTYLNKITAYICTSKSNFGCFLENHREEVRRKGSTKEGTITVVKTKTTPKGLVLESIRLETERDIKERAMQMKNFHMRNGFMEHVPDYFLNMKMKHSSDDEDDYEGEIDENGEEEDVRVVINKSTLSNFRRNLTSGTTKDIATVDAIGKHDLDKKQQSDIESTILNDDIDVVISSDVPRTQVDNSELVHVHGSRQVEAEIGKEVPMEEKEHLSVLERESRRERAKAMIIGLLNNESTYYVASESEYLLYRGLFDYTGAIFPFMTQTKAFCKEIREKGLYGGNALNTYRKFISHTMVTSNYFIPPEDVQELLKEKDKTSEIVHSPPHVSTEGTSEESGSYNTCNSSKNLSGVESFLSASERYTFREQSTKSVMEGEKLNEKWSRVSKRCEKDDGIPLTILTMEAMCAQWEEVSRFSIALMEAYQNLFAVTSCIENEVDATAQIDEQARHGGVFVSTNQFRALRNALACIRNRKQNIIKCTFEGRS